MIVIGIDPGKTGAIAFVGKGVAGGRVFDCPTIETRAGKKVRIVLDGVGMASLILKNIRGDCHAYVEKAQAMPDQGVTGVFNYGTGYGIWLGILAGKGVPHTLVRPTIWKGVMLGSMGKDKDSSRLRAIQLFPELHEQLKLKKNDGRAEALLIAEYGRRELAGQ